MSRSKSVTPINWESKESFLFCFVLVLVLTSWDVLTSQGCKDKESLCFSILCTKASRHCLCGLTRLFSMTYMLGLSLGNFHRLPYISFEECKHYTVGNEIILKFSSLTSDKNIESRDGLETLRQKQQ